VSFVSAGAKNYVYKTFKGISKAIVQGFSLNNVAINSVNFESIEDIVINDNSKTLRFRLLINAIDIFLVNAVLLKTFKLYHGEIK
jgi:molybdenum cofactor biosynthesis enzyme MoaA